MWQISAYKLWLIEFFLQILDDEPAPSQSHLEEITKERLARAATKKRSFKKRYNMITIMDIQFLLLTLKFMNKKH